MAQTPSTWDDYVGDGVEDTFQVTFPYQKQQEVFVTVDGDPVAFAFISAGWIQLAAVPASGAAIRVQRSTDAFEPRHEFANGVPLLPRFIDENNKQFLYVVQEAVNETAGVAADALSAAEGAVVIAQTASDKVDAATLDSALVLRQELAFGGGAAMIGGAGQVVSSIASLRELLKTSPSKSAFVTGYYAQGDGGGGAYYLDQTDTSSSDNGGTVIVAADGARWKLARTGEVSIKQFGARATGAEGNNAYADLNSERIQACLDYCSEEGAIAYIPRGEYAFSSTLRLFENIWTQEPLGGSTKAGIRGEGSGLSVLRWTGGAGRALEVTGEVISLQTLKGVGFLGLGNLGTGIYLKDLAWFHMEDVMVTGFEYGLDAYNLLSSKIDTAIIRGNKFGARFQRGEGVYSSQPNAITLINCDIGQNAEWGILVWRAGVFNLIGGAVQGNGIAGSAAEKWGLRSIDAGVEGASGVNLLGVYFEANVGLADVMIEQYNYGAPHSIVGCGFTRVPWAFTTNCIRVDNVPAVKTTLTMTGNGFLGTAGYVPSYARQYLLVQNTTTNFTLSELGSTYSSDIEAHELAGRHVTKHTALAAGVAYNGVARAPKRYINVASVARVAAGRYRVTFATPMASNAYVANVCLENAAGFCYANGGTADGLTVHTLDFAGNPTDLEWACQVFE